MSRGLWRNSNCLDIDFYIEKVTYRGPEYIKAKVLYIYRQSGQMIHSSPVLEKIYFKRDRQCWNWIG